MSNEEEQKGNASSSQVQSSRRSESQNKKFTNPHLSLISSVESTRTTKTNDKPQFEKKLTAMSGNIFKNAGYFFSFYKFKNKIIIKETS